MRKFIPSVLDPVLDKVLFAIAGVVGGLFNAGLVPLWAFLLSLVPPVALTLLLLIHVSRGKRQ